MRDAECKLQECLFRLGYPILALAENLPLPMLMTKQEEQWFWLNQHIRMGMDLWEG